MRLLLAAAAVLTAGASSAPAPMEVLLRPVVADGAVTGIAVQMLLPRGQGEGFALSAPVVYPGAPGAADRMQGIELSDTGGRVPLTVRDDPAVPGGFPYHRHWTATRPVRFPARLSYSALVQPPGGAGGPAFGIRAVGGGVAGSGATFLLLPEKAEAQPIRVRWNLSGFGRAGDASSSFGERDFALTARPGRLTGGWYMAGPLGRLPMRGGFGATWLGRPPFNAAAEMATAARGHAFLAGYFPHLRPAPPYRVFLQFREEPPFGGATALEQSFMYAAGPPRPGTVPAAPLSTVFHEMIHQWVGGIDAPQGENSWFSEGLTSYYEAELPLLGGFQSAADYQRHINRYTEEYYTSRARNWSAAAITKVGFADEEVRHTPYRRSELYFHDLDARIRAKSGGRRTLDSLLFPMFVTREKGAAFDTAAWVRLVTAELGEQEKGRFERLILAGTDTLEPRADSFGPCFTRAPATFEHDGRRVEGFRWVRVPGVPDARCK